MIVIVLNNTFYISRHISTSKQVRFMKTGLVSIVTEADKL